MSTSPSKAPSPTEPVTICQPLQSSIVLEPGIWLGLPLPTGSFDILNPSHDWAFKAIMQDPELVKDVIDVVLDLAGDSHKKFTTITIQPPAMLSRSPRISHLTADLIAVEPVDQGPITKIVAFEMQTSVSSTYCEKLITEVLELRTSVSRFQTSETRVTYRAHDLKAPVKLSYSIDLSAVICITNKCSPLIC
ncbi:hypothetical protein RCL1_002677 [Eukaryota sp. TZLM3-RCL]